MPNINIYLTEKEEEDIVFRMKISGETAKGTHIKRVYFEGGRQDNEQLGRMQKQLDLMTDELENVAKTLRHIKQMKTDGVEMKLLAGLYLLLHPSVEKKISQKADEYIDVEAVKKFLEEKGE